MTIHPYPVMQSTQIPQQRLYAVPDLTEKPEGLEFLEGEPGIDGIPKKIPRRASFLLQVEWAWSPAHNMILNYHLSLSSKQDRWVLWNSWFDDGNSWRWRIGETVLSMSRDNVPRTNAAILLLHEDWKIGRDDHEWDRYHWLAVEGLLDVGQAQEIARQVWGEYE